MADQNKKPSDMHVNINLDTTPVLYTDNISMNVNPDGIVFDVMQRVGQTNQHRIVARIGMSKEHAKKLVQKLGQILLKSEGEVETGKKIIN